VRPLLLSIWWLLEAVAEAVAEVEQVDCFKVLLEFL
jgi:hypothetical protein